MHTFMIPMPNWPLLTGLAVLARTSSIFDRCQPGACCLHGQYVHCEQHARFPGVGVLLMAQVGHYYGIRAASRGLRSSFHEADGPSVLPRAGPRIRQSYLDALRTLHRQAPCRDNVHDCLPRRKHLELQGYVLQQFTWLSCFCVDWCVEHENVELAKGC